MSVLNLNGGLISCSDFSLTETKTGATWTNGKPIYMKTASGTNLSGTTSTDRVTWSLSAAVSDVSSFIAGFGYARLKDNTYSGRCYSIPGNMYNPSLTPQLGSTFIISDSGGISVNYVMNRTLSWIPTKVDLVITVFYTKTTD